MTACSCPAGRYIDEAVDGESCTECEAGTFKVLSRQPMDF